MNVLFLSNGHGEDLNASLIISALRESQPDVTIQALALVGEGNAYRKLNIPLIAPTQTLPSGGIIYTSPLNWLRDIASGLFSLIFQQLHALFHHRSQADLLVAVGDIVPLTFAYLTGKPFIAFIVSTSSYYEGRLRLPWLTELYLRSERCRQIIAKDQFTAQDLQRRGMKKALCVGYPIMDALNPSGRVIVKTRGHGLIALLPGSRIPEALNNLGELLGLCQALSQQRGFDFAAALVPSITEADIERLAQRLGWQWRDQKLIHGNCQVDLYWNDFADIIHSCDLVLGMAGTAVEQAVGLGKPVVQIPGHGPQFTYAFAEAQMRYLGPSVTLVGKHPQEPGLVRNAVKKILEILDDPHYSAHCRANGLERMGTGGGAHGIANLIQLTLKSLSPSNPTSMWVEKN